MWTGEEARTDSHGKDFSGRDRVAEALVDAPAKDQILKMCREVLSPLVRADGGEMYVVGVTVDEVHIHLAGTCAGCPGAQLTRDRVLEPAIASIAPKMSLKLTTGWNVPQGAQKV